MTKDYPIIVKPTIELGVVPTHLRFAGGLVPDEKGRLPRGADEELVVVAGMRELVEQSPVRIGRVQVSLFPGTRPEDLDTIVPGLKALGLEVDFVLMVGGVNPMEPKDEDAVLAQLLPLLQSSVRHGASHVASTSIEAWMRAFQWMNALPTLTHLSAARHAASAAWAKHVVEQAAEQRKANDARLGITRPPPQWGRVYEKPTP